MQELVRKLARKPWLIATCCFAYNKPRFMYQFAKVYLVRTRNTCFARKPLSSWCKASVSCAYQCKQLVLTLHILVTRTQIGDPKEVNRPVKALCGT